MTRASSELDSIASVVNSTPLNRLALIVRTLLIVCVSYKARIRVSNVISIYEGQVEFIMNQSESQR